MLRVPRFTHPNFRGWVLMIEEWDEFHFTYIYIYNLYIYIYVYVCIYVANSRLLMIVLCPVFDGSLNVNHHF